MLGFISENLIHVPVIAIGYFKIPIDFLLKILCLCKLFIKIDNFYCDSMRAIVLLKMVKLYSLYILSCNNKNFKSVVTI